MDARSFTTQPVAATTGIDPEWVDWRGLEAMFAIGRSSAYTDISTDPPKYHSVVLRRKGKIKGRRLFEVASVREFLASQTGDVDPRLSALNREANRVMREKAKEKAQIEPHEGKS